MLIDRLSYALLPALLCASLSAQTAPPKPMPVLMLSDIHFDPFRDPAKSKRLAESPVSGWDAILEEPATPSQAADFQVVQKTCATKGLDTGITLFDGALKAAKVDAAQARFVTISGDLLVHQFECRYKLAIKDGADYAAFAEKTTEFVIRHVEAAFAGIPVYFALGNNDSSCGDYRMDLHDRYFSGTSDAVARGWRNATPAEVKLAKEDYETGGYYSVPLPGMQKTRLLVIDDIYMSNKYKTCGNKVSTAGADATLTWLKDQLHQASERREKIWVIGHIPPGIDVYATLRKGNACAAETFLAGSESDTLSHALTAYSGVVRLALFGHSHMDEFKVLTSGDAGVPLKQVGSISPVDGNLPSFTVASIDAAKSEMSDYSVYTAASATAGGGKWTKEYGFRETYHQPEFTAAALAGITAGFHADQAGATAPSQAYEQYFDAGFPMSPLLLGWPQYACGIDHMTASEYKTCACPAP